MMIGKHGQPLRHEVQGTDELQRIELVYSKVAKHGYLFDMHLIVETNRIFAIRGRVPQDEARVLWIEIPRNTFGSSMYRFLNDAETKAQRPRIGSLIE